MTVISIVLLALIVLVVALLLLVFKLIHLVPTEDEEAIKVEGEVLSEKPLTDNQDKDTLVAEFED